jgi:hypothetical protein
LSALSRAASCDAPLRRAFRVSVSFVVNLMKAVRGRELCAKPSGGRRHAKLEPDRAFLLAQGAEKVATSSVHTNAKTTSPPQAMDSHGDPAL